MASLEWLRLQPTDEELVILLEKKRLDPALDDPIIKELNVYNYHPRELLGLSSMPNEQFCYFFCTLVPKHAKGKLVNREAKEGFWKITCPDQEVKSNDSNIQIGIIKTLSFYEGSTTKKENRTDWKMYEYHEYPCKDNFPSKGETVLCCIGKNRDKIRKRSSALDARQPIDSLLCHAEKKRDKKRKRSSAIDDGQLIDSFAYDSRNNVSEDILQVEPQPPQNLHMPSSYDNDIANSSLMEVETHLPPNQHISHLMKDTFQELESQLLPNQLMPPIIGDPVAKYIFELESQLLPKQHVSALIGDHVAKATMSQLESQLLQLPNFHWSSTIEDHLRNNSFSEMEEPQLLPNQHVCSNFEDYVAKSTFFEIESQLLANHQLSSDIENNAAKSFPSEVRPLGPAKQDELVDFNGLDHNSFSTLQSPLYPTPGSFYSSSFGHDLVHWPNQNSFSALQSPMYQSPGCLYSGSLSHNSTNGLDLNSFSTLQSPGHPQSGSSYSSGFSNDSTNGINYNCFSAQHFPIHPLLESSYSNSFGNDSTNGLEHNAESALQTPIYPQPGSSYSSGSGNDLNTMTPQFAAAQEDDLAHSHWSVQDDFSSPETGYISPDFNSLEAVVGGYVGGDGSDSVIETFSAWPNQYVSMASGVYRF